MEDLYEALECCHDASYEELKRAYKTLALVHHPDKVAQIPDVSESEKLLHHNRFIAIDKAWKVLGDKNCKEEYDAVWHQRCLAQLWPVQETVHFEDLEILQYGEEEVSQSNNATAMNQHLEGNPTGETYVHPCRCGGQYTMTAADVHFHVDYVCCVCCSLCIQILYSGTEYPK